jgi:hypothetical protein
LLWRIGNRLYSRQRYQGHIDRYRDGEVDGWAASHNSPGAIAIDLRIDGKTLIQAKLADQFRADLQEAGVGDGRHGFRVDIGHLPEGTLIELIESRTGALLSSLIVAWNDLATKPFSVKGVDSNVESIARTLEPHFDADFYLEQFDGTLPPEDPVRHYIETGWQNGLDPHPEFSTLHYLELNADVRERRVNPYWHYVVAGRTERRSPKPPQYTKMDKLGGLRSLEDIKASWQRKEQPPEALSTDEICGSPQFRNAVGKTNVLMSICHDPYKEIAGGIQLCARLEEQKMLDAGQGHLSIYPWQPLPKLADAGSNALVVLHAQGEPIGPVRLRDLGESIARTKPTGSQVAVAVHSLLGHEPEALAAFLEAFGPSNVLIWLHDHFTLCEGYTLRRNTVAYCGAPHAASPACGICIYGQNRTEHSDRIARFFDATRPTVVAPSLFQLDFWSSKSSLPRGRSLVHPLAKIAPPTTPVPAPAITGQDLRIGFLGWPADHKGWDAFCDLAARGRGRDIEFHYFGTTSVSRKGIVSHHLDVSPERPDAAIMALWNAGIDIVVHWAGWPETFSFTAHEALAADALLVTSPLSGNVAALATLDPRVLVLPDEDALRREVLEGEIAALALARRTGRKCSSLIYSAASADIVLAGAKGS